MAYYRHTYMPGFTTNDTYGNFYDGKKASLITVPDRLKNYDMDLRATRTATSGAEYGDFMSQQELQYQEQAQQPQWPLKPYGGAYSQREPMEGLDRHVRPPPPPPMPPGRGAALPPPPPPLPDPEPLASSREPPPPVSVERYRNPDRTRREQPEEAEARRHARSRSPPPPPDLGTYRTNMQVYTGRQQMAPPALGRQPGPPPSPPSSPGSQLAPPAPPPPPPQHAMTGAYGRELQPALKFGAREIHLPEIEAVELHMRDKSKVILNVREFYNRYLRD